MNKSKKSNIARPAPSTPVHVNICLGDRTEAIGRLVFVRDGQREFSQFAYSESWLNDEGFFSVSPDLKNDLGYQLRKPLTNHDSRFFLALADTEPDAWGRRVIARAHAKRRQADPTVQALSEFDYLSAADDFSRVGALRLRTDQGDYLADNHNKRKTPPLLELEKILSASRAIELNQETTEDLAYLQGKATSLGGMRPKCTLLDHDGALALAKFPSIGDERAVTKAEVLALTLARKAGINAATARTVNVGDQPVAVIRRFDRSNTGDRVPYMSGATLLQANRDQERSYLELLDAMRMISGDYVADTQELFKRIAFNCLINNVDDHLQNIGFLYTAIGMWRLAPAFDVNPFPDESPDSKTWLSPDTGPITEIDQLIEYAPYFELDEQKLRSIMSELVHAVSKWTLIAQSPSVGMSNAESNPFKRAFEGQAIASARSWLG